MLYIACALFDEASVWIEEYRLKKNTQISKFQVFEGEEICLIITGTGIMKATIALTYLCTIRPPERDDVFMNIGVCGASNPNMTGLFLIHKITGDASGRAYYPDILYAHPFREAMVTSFFNVQTKAVPGLQLVDMEAEGFWCAANTFFGPDRMLFFKYVSDFCDGTMITKQKVREIGLSVIKTLKPWLEENFLTIKSCHLDQQWECDPMAVEGVLVNLKATEAMKEQLYTYLYYNKLRKIDSTSILAQYASVICKNKKESMQVFNRLLEDLKTEVRR